jgi:hypothetical protein
MATKKTQPTLISAAEFVNNIEDENVRKDASQLISVMQTVTKQPPVMWGGSIIGFGSYHYKYASGHEGDICKIGFAPRKNQFALYISCNIQEQEALLQKLGKHKTGKGCLYIKKLSDIDMAVLKQMIKVGYLAQKAGEE